MGIKRALLKSLTVPGITIPFRALLNDRATILMLHRFHDPENGIEGLDPAALADGLAWLRRNDYELVRLDDLFERMAGHGPPLRRTVAFTIDDGYYDHALVAAPVFARFDCPSTTFVTSGFLDRALWMWWDRIHYLFAHTEAVVLEFLLGGKALRYELAEGRAAAAEDFVNRCIAVADEVKQRAIVDAAEAGRVTLPEQAPPGYRPMSWDELRAAERLGMNFAPHTVTHPILARTTDAQSQWELAESWRRLRTEAADPVNIFAYPNGQFEDFGNREVETLRKLGFAGAVVGVGGHTSAQAFRDDPDERFRVRRLGYLPALGHLVKQVSGVERFQQILRAEDAA
ncbi:MAG: polysaccharide deacetylase family protein [Gammaproteobacteria bacterium]